MDHLADSIAKLSQGRENWYIGREGIPVDDSSGEKCEPVIVIECMDLSIGHVHCKSFAKTTQLEFKILKILNLEDI